MSSKYIGLDSEKSYYAQKNMLKIQLELLTSIKRIHSYNQSRKEELVLKIALKKKIDEIRELINIIDKILPKIKMPSNEKGKKEELIFNPEIRRRSSLEQELDEIRQKLEKLQ